MVCVPWILFFFVFLIKKNWGTEIDYNWFVSPTICCFWSETQKKQNPGDTSHKKNQISLFENKKKSFKLFACVLSSGQKKSQSISINFKKNKADIGSFIKFASKLVSIVFFVVLLFSCFGYIFFLEFSFFYYLI